MLCVLAVQLKADTGGYFSLPGCVQINSISETGNTATILTFSTTGVSIGTLVDLAGIADLRYDGLHVVTAVTTNTSFAVNLTASGLSAGVAKSPSQFGAIMVYAIPQLIFAGLSNFNTLDGTNVSIPAANVSPCGPVLAWAAQNMDAANGAEFVQPEDDEPFDLPPGSAQTPITTINGLSGLKFLYGFSSASANVVIRGGKSGTSR